MSIALRDEDIVLLNEYADLSFDLDESIESAKIFLEELNKQPLNHCQFDSDIWGVAYLDGVNRTFFKFEKIKTSIQFVPHLNKEEKFEFVQVVKCWIAHLLQRVELYSVVRYFRCLHRFIEYSQCFNPDQKVLTEAKEKINQLNEKTKHNAFITCIGALNFLDYYQDLDSNNVYSNLLLELKEEMGLQFNVRTLPNPKDVFLFNQKLDEYFGALSPNSPEYLYFFPIYLWWNLSNKIPLRPFELCGIKRDGLKEKNNQFHIKLPRSNKKGSKKRNVNRIQLIDTVKISNDLGKAIQAYIDNTKKYGESETLLSSKANKQTYEAVFNRTNAKVKLNDSKYSLVNLYQDIDRFYELVIEKKFGLTVRPRETFDESTQILNDHYDFTYKIRPGDTRHFAFINLMKLGYNPVEIARLGGHLKLNSQYHYHSHEQFLIDIEILQLMNKFSYKKSFSTFKDEDETKNHNMRNAFTEHFGLEQLIKDKFVRATSSSGQTKNKKLDLGFCKDPLQRCKVNDCPLCDDWGISINEYREKREVIIKKVENAYNHIKDVVSTIIEIHKYIISQYNKAEDVDDLNIDLNRDLTIQAKQFKQAVQEYLELATIEQRKVDYNA
ncbi:hypothetical protein [Metabacillus malikii]|uniref:Integrase n=1 Tax=Metabacillus malikii TaxID=1504265 RepID=A0ABT9Z9C6_9BACI|nr:hypothetical protein [Metabacillus malikii]MDQ0228866.1 hypothetical protein [Metabacillus malikii]